MLRPVYSPPNRKDIGGHLPDQVHEKIASKVSTELQGKEVVLIQDGWSDIHNTPVIATSLQCEGKSYILSAVDAGTNKKTAAYCTSVAQEAISTATEQYQCTVTGVVTDNEKMVAMKQNLHDSNPELTVYGCSAHWLNLLGQDITPAQVINQVVEINKYFRNHHIPGPCYLKYPIHSVKPQLPAETRWNSQLTCIDTYIRNRPYMPMIIAKNEELIDPRIRSIIHNVGLFNEVKHLQLQLQPVSNGLDRLQSDSSTLADACETWIDLLQNSDLQTYKDKVHHRFQKAMTPTHYLANILHSQYRGKLLLPDQVSSAQDLLLQTNPDMLPDDLLSFMTDSLEISNTLLPASVITRTRPTVWWLSLSKSSPVSKDLCSLAQKILKMPSSSASIERVFFNFGLIQTKLRNRLGLQKAAKLVFSYWYLRRKEDIDW
jgi:hypothetical protein